MKTTFDEYRREAGRAAPASPWMRNFLRAFFTGGAVCLLGELLGTLYRRLGAEASLSGTLVSLSMILLASFFTGLGVYDIYGGFAGAGSLVPITGFANSMTACAIEFRREGIITGLGAKMFLIAGPVIVYGTAAGAIYGLILMLGRLKP